MWVSPDFHRSWNTIFLLISFKHSKTQKVHLAHGPQRGRPLQYSCLENPMDWGAWRATVHRVTKSQTWLKRLSMHSRHVIQFPLHNDHSVCYPLAILFSFKGLFCSWIFREFPTFYIINKDTVKIIAYKSLYLSLIILFLSGSLQWPYT